MPLPAALQRSFSSSARARGEAYAAAKRVRITEVTPTEIRAVVRGTEPYDVRVRLEETVGARRPLLRVSCTCPHFYDGPGTCKHIWATLVDASHLQDTFVSDLHTPGRTAVDVAPIDDIDETDEIDEPDPAAGVVESGDPMSGLDIAALSRMSSREVRAFLRSRWAASAGAGGPPKPPPPPKRTKTAGQQLIDAVAAGLPSAPPPAAFPYQPDELMYVLDIDAVRYGGLAVELMARRRKKDGTWGEPKPAHLTAPQLALAPADVMQNLTTLGVAAFTGGGYSAYALPSRYPVPSMVAHSIVPRLAETGRTFVRASSVSPDLIPVAWDPGDPWRFVILAEPLGENLVLSARFERGQETLPIADVIVLLESGLLVTKTTIARAMLPPSRALYTAVGRAGVALSASETTMLRDALARSGQTSPDLPEVLRVAEIDVAPIKCAALVAANRRGVYHWVAVQVEFDYDGTPVADEPTPAIWDEARRRLIRRRPDAEAAALAELPEMGASQAWDPYERRQMWRMPSSAVPRFIRDAMARGWRVQADGRSLRSPSRVTMSVSSGIDWFDLEASVEFEGETVPLTSILDALRRGDTMVPLENGTAGVLPQDWLARYAPLAAMGEAADGRIRFTLPQTALLDALLDAQAAETAVAIDARFDAARRALTRFDRITPADPPASFQGVLRPYQKDALGWLAFLGDLGFGGCLADDMGLGKTVMVLARLAGVHGDAGPEGPASVRPGPADGRPGPADGRRPSLVVAPRSLVHNWIAEAARFTPSLRVRDVSHATRKTAAGLWDDVDVAIATYGTLRRDISQLKDRKFEYVILDEAQAIKNATTASAKAARLLRGRHRLALSGTPIENHLGELWSLIEFLNPGLLGRSTVLASAAGGRRTVDPETAVLLSRALRPFILRRTKAQVATDLPARTEQTIVCELEGKQRTFYDSLRAHYRQALLGRIDRVGLGRSKIQVLEALLRLRQAACHPQLVDDSLTQARSAKLDVLLPRLREVIAEGHKALVFSQFTSFLAHVRSALDEEGVTYEYLDGETRDRGARVERFQTDPACGVFLISLKAGGLGLNLTGAEYVFLLDPWWNPAVEAQAIDRAHRIGQTQQVFAYRLIAGDTVEEKVLALQESKRALADAILRADAGLIGQLGRDEIEMLLT